MIQDFFKYSRDLKFYLIATLSGFCFSSVFKGYDIPLPKAISHLSSPFFIVFLLLTTVCICTNFRNIFILYKKERINFIFIVSLVLLLSFLFHINWALISLSLLLVFYPGNYKLAAIYLFIWPILLFILILIIGLIFPELGREPTGKVGSFFEILTGLRAFSLGFANPNQPLFFLMLITINGSYIFFNTPYKRIFAISMIIIATLIYIFTLSRTSYIVIMVFLTLYLLRNIKIYKFLKKHFYIILILFTIISFFSALKFGDFNNPVNRFMTNRPYYWNLRVKDGVIKNILGNKDRYKNTSGAESALDNNYINLVSRYGWIVYAIVFYLLISNNKSKKYLDDKEYLLGLLAIMIYFLSESMPITMTLSIIPVISLKRKIENINE